MEIERYGDFRIDSPSSVYVNNTASSTKYRYFVEEAVYCTKRTNLFHYFQLNPNPKWSTMLVFVTSSLSTYFLTKHCFEKTDFISCWGLELDIFLNLKFFSLYIFLNTKYKFPSRHVFRGFNTLCLKSQCVKRWNKKLNQNKIEINSNAFYYCNMSPK